MLGLEAVDKVINLTSFNFKASARRARRAAWAPSALHTCVRTPLVQPRDLRFPRVWPGLQRAWADNPNFGRRVVDLVYATVRERGFGRKVCLPGREIVFAVHHVAS